MSPQQAWYQDRYRACCARLGTEDDPDVREDIRREIADLAIAMGIV